MQQPEFLDSITSQVGAEHIKQTVCKNQVVEIHSDADESDAAVFIPLVFLGHPTTSDWAGLHSGGVPAGPVFPGEPLQRPSGRQEAGGHLGTLHQRMFLLPGSADGSERGDGLNKHTPKHTD